MMFASVYVEVEGVFSFSDYGMVTFTNNCLL